MPQPSSSCRYVRPPVAVSGVSTALEYCCKPFRRPWRQPGSGNGGRIEGREQSTLKGVRAVQAQRLFDPLHHNQLLPAAPHNSRALRQPPAHRPRHHVPPRHQVCMDDDDAGVEARLPGACRGKQVVQAEQEGTTTRNTSPECAAEQGEAAGGGGRGRRSCTCTWVGGREGCTAAAAAAAVPVFLVLLFVLQQPAMGGAARAGLLQSGGGLKVSWRRATRRSPPPRGTLAPATTLAQAPAPATTC